VRSADIAADGSMDGSIALRLCERLLAVDMFRSACFF
jgi:hypothetical protein